jgi:hypothetical protein
VSAPWSYSSLTSFETCPRRYKIVRLDRAITEPQTEAMLHGTTVHKVLEDGISGAAPVPELYSKYAPLVEAARAAPGEKFTEMKFGLDRALSNVGFFSPSVWVRGVLDFAVVRGDHAVIVDWKTGKPKLDHDQLTLFAAAAFSVFDQVNTVDTAYAWLAYDKMDSQDFAREEMPAVWAEFRARAARVDLAAATGVYPPKPSGLCRKHCPVPFKTCEFSGRT